MNNVHQGHKLRQHTSFLSVTEMSDVVDYPPPIIAALAKKSSLKSDVMPLGSRTPPDLCDYTSLVVRETGQRKCFPIRQAVSFRYNRGARNFLHECVPMPGN